MIVFRKRGSCCDHLALKVLHVMCQQFWVVTSFVYSVSYPITAGIPYLFSRQDVTGYTRARIYDCAMGSYGIKCWKGTVQGILGGTKLPCRAWRQHVTADKECRLALWLQG